MPATALHLQLKTPSAEQNEAYAACLRFDRLRSLQRGAGRSGYLTAEQEAALQLSSRTVDAALADGVGFDRMAFAEA